MEERLEAGPERERERENEKKRQAAALEREPAKFSSSLLAAQFFTVRTIFFFLAKIMFVNQISKKLYD